MKTDQLVKFNIVASMVTKDVLDGYQDIVLGDTNSGCKKKDMH